MRYLAGSRGVGSWYKRLCLGGPAAMAGWLVLANRAMSIAGGTSEIKPTQIGERILGLPRDPLIN